MSAKTGAGSTSFATRSAGGGAVSETRPPARWRRASTSIASSRCAGSARSRPGRSGPGRSPRATAPRRAGRPRRARPQRRGARRAVDWAEAGQRVAVALPGVERANCAAATRSIAPGAGGRATGSTSRSTNSNRSGRRATARPPRNGCRLARIVRIGERYAQLRLPEPVVAARGDRVVLRTHATVGGGAVSSTRAPSRHADPARFEQARRGEARVHAPVLVGGEWRFSGEWLAELEARAGARARPGQPARSGNAGADRAVGEGRARPASARAARLDALPAGRDRRTRRTHRRRRTAAGVGCCGGARRREGRTMRSCPVSSSVRAGSCGSATAGR